MTSLHGSTGWGEEVACLFESFSNFGFDDEGSSEFQPDFDDSESLQSTAISASKKTASKDEENILDSPRPSRRTCSKSRKDRSSSKSKSPRERGRSSDSSGSKSSKRASGSRTSSKSPKRTSSSRSSSKSPKRTSSSRSISTSPKPKRTSSSKAESLSRSPKRTSSSPKRSSTVSPPLLQRSVTTGSGSNLKKSSPKNSTADTLLSSSSRHKLKLRRCISDTPTKAALRASAEEGEVETKESSVEPTSAPLPSSSSSSSSSTRRSRSKSKKTREKKSSSKTKESSAEPTSVPVSPSPRSQSKSRALEGSSRSIGSKTIERSRSSSNHRSPGKRRVLRTASVGSLRRRTRDEEHARKHVTTFNTHELGQVRRSRLLASKRQNAQVFGRGGLNRSESLIRMASLGDTDEDIAVGENSKTASDTTLACRSPRRRVSRSPIRGAGLRRTMSMGAKAEGKKIEDVAEAPKRRSDTSLSTATSPRGRVSRGLNRTMSLRKTTSMKDQDRTSSRSRTRSPPPQKRNVRALQREQLKRSLSVGKDWAFPEPSNDEISAIPAETQPKASTFALGPSQIYAAYTA